VPSITCINEDSDGNLDPGDTTRDIHAPLDYHIGRLPYTTVIRPVPTPSTSNPTAVAWILNHSDGCLLGALYTTPEYRRRGLARMVTQERVREAEKDGIRGFSFVCVGNEARGREDVGGYGLDQGLEGAVGLCEG
jgi:GNAT superfamily N-acetyltransferase